jgi:STE24 endopeptidase
MDMEIDAAQPAQQVEIDQERQAKAKVYARIRRRLSYISMAIGAIGVCLLLFTGLAGWIGDRLHGLSWQPVRGWFPLQVLCFFLVVMLVYEIVTAPIGYYGFTLSRRYGLSVMTLKSWLRDLFVGLALELVLGIAVFELIYWLLAAQPNTWWLWVGLVLLFFSVIMANLAPVLLFPLFYKFHPMPEGDLTQRLLALADRAHTRVRGVYTFDMSRKTTAANAALMGLGNTRRIVLGDTMLDRYTPEEIEVVLAHELGHHVHHDIWKLIISQSLTTLAGLYLANLVFHWAVETQHFYAGLADAATIPLLLALTALFGLIVMPLNNGISRSVEYQADDYALQSTGMVEQFKRAMTRMANQNLSDIQPSPIIEFLFYDHPSVGKRLKHAEEYVGRT